MPYGPFEIASIVVAAAALAGYLNDRTLKLPQTIALTAMGVAVSVLVLLVDAIFPAANIDRAAAAFMDNIDFRAALLNVMLSFLLFAGALQLDLKEMRQGEWLIAALSTAGVVISTLIVAGGFWAVAQLFGLAVPFAWCVVFGALISPTDPVAVIALLQGSAAPPLLKTTVASESLFNDGVAVVVFAIALGAAASGEKFDLVEGVRLFVFEAGGGAALGLALGFIGFAMMRSIDDYVTQALISVALTMAGYSVAAPLGVSGPVAMAVAGVVVGNFAVKGAMTDVARAHFLGFWDLVERILNAALFLLIGLQGVTLLERWGLLAVGLACIPLVLLARAASVLPPLELWRRLVTLRQAFPILTWGGLRGGLCIAMALSLPKTPVRDIVLACTYVVVLFSVIVQGMTMNLVIRRALSPASPGGSAAAAAPAGPPGAA
jgi:CPA1 family monovalent cation:H+ antiporter